MAKPFHKMSVSERVLQKRLTSAPPKPKDGAGAAPAEPLRVAPLAPPPVFDEAVIGSGASPVAPTPQAQAKPEAPPEQPRLEVQKAEAPQPQTKPEAPKAEAKAEAPKAEPQHRDEPEAPQQQAKPEAPKAEPQTRPEAPRAQAKPETPKAAEVERSVAPVSTPGRDAGSAPVPPSSKRVVEPLDLDPTLDPISSAPERPGRLKLAMAALAAFATVVGIGIGVRITRARAARRAAAAKALVAAQAAPSVETPAPPPPPPVETAAATAEPATSAIASATATADATASAVATAEPAAGSSVAAALDERATSARALRDESLALLKKYKNPEAMAKASAALDADPSDAMPYLVLGSALQDANRWREARRAYELCVKNATKGMVDECRAMLRRR